MSKKSFNESRENKNYVNSEGLKQRRLKNENRWKFNPAYSYDEESDEYEEENQYSSYEFHGNNKEISQ